MPFEICETKLLYQDGWIQKGATPNTKAFPPGNQSDLR